MDSGKRDRLRTEIDVMQMRGVPLGAPWLLAFVPVLLVALLAGIWGDISGVIEQWPRRNYKEARATVLSHEFAYPDGGDEGMYARGRFGRYVHVVEYTYAGNGIPFTNTIKLPYLESGLNLKPGSKFKVYYRLERPLDHQLFLDPSHVVWGGLARLGGIVAFFVALSAVIVYFALTYRRRRRVPQDAKFQMP